MMFLSLEGRGLGLGCAKLVQGVFFECEIECFSLQICFLSSPKTGRVEDKI